MATTPQGNRAPDLIRPMEVKRDVNGDLLAPLIRAGRPNQGMPAFPALTAGQLADIVIFLHSQASEALASAHLPKDYPLRKLLTGNAAAGKAYFNADGGCASCHSPTVGPCRDRPPIQPDRLAAAHAYPPGKARVTASITLPDGRVPEGAVLHADEFDVAITGPDGWYRS